MLEVKPEIVALMLEETMFQSPGAYPPAPAGGPPSSTQYQHENQYNSDCTTSTLSSQPSATYQLKTMCLAKKTVQMPTKEEHGFLLFLWSWCP